MGPWGGYAAHQGYSQQGYLGQPGQHQGGMGPWGGYAAHQGYGQQGYVGQPGQHQWGMGPWGGYAAHQGYDQRPQPVGMKIYLLLCFINYLLVCFLDKKASPTTEALIQANKTLLNMSYVQTRDNYMLLNSKP